MSLYSISEPESASVTLHCKSVGISARGRGFALALSCSFAGAVLVANSFGIQYFLFILLFILPSVWLIACNPSAFEFSSTGFRIHWSDPFISYSSPWITWNKVSKIQFVSASSSSALVRRLGPPDDLVDEPVVRITFDVSDILGIKRIPFDLMSVGITRSYERTGRTIQLFENGFLQDIENQTLQTVLMEKPPPGMLTCKATTV